MRGKGRRGDGVRGKGSSQCTRREVRRMRGDRGGERCGRGGGQGGGEELGHYILVHDLDIKARILAHTLMGG